MLACSVENSLAGFSLLRRSRCQHGDRRCEAAEKEAAGRRATDVQVLLDLDPVRRAARAIGFETMASQLSGFEYALTT